MIIQGLTLGGIAVPLLVDASGRVIVTADNPSYEQPTGIIIRYTNLNLAAGTSANVAYTVPANQRIILDNIAVQYTGTVAGVILFPQLYDGTNIVNFTNFNNLVSGLFYGYAVSAVMEAGWAIRCTVTGATLNDDLQVDLSMRRIK